MRLLGQMVQTEKSLDTCQLQIALFSILLDIRSLTPHQSQDVLKTLEMTCLHGGPKPDSVTV